MSKRTAKIDDDYELLTALVQRYDNAYDPFLEKIISSPYIGDRHALRLLSLEMPYRLLANALRSLEPQKFKDYTVDIYEDIFNLEEIRALVQQQSMQSSYDFPETRAYVIAFRSALTEEVRTSEASRKALAEIDINAHIEANESGGLLKYWFGVPDDTSGRNLATCFWRSKADAKRGGGGKAHRQGVTRVQGWYAYWEVLEFELLLTVQAQNIILQKL